MHTVNPQYITNINGEKISVILPVKVYNNILEELEELEDIRLYDKSKSANEASYPIDEAFKIIEAKRKIK